MFQLSGTPEVPNTYFSELFRSQKTKIDVVLKPQFVNSKVSGPSGFYVHTLPSSYGMLYSTPSLTTSSRPHVSCYRQHR